MTLIGTNSSRDVHIEISDEDAPLRMNAVHKDAKIRFWIERHEKTLTLRYVENGRGVLVQAHHVHNGFASDANMLIEVPSSHSIILR